MNPLRIFNLDLHISVIEDIKDICKRVFDDRVVITNWSISDHNWVFQKETKDVYHINKATWKTISMKSIQDFQELYDEELGSYDAFVVTHTPVFALLFEKYKKPILIVNTCRYDQPFCWTENTEMAQYLNKALCRMVESKQTIIVSNNIADHIYLKDYTQIVSPIIPSLCLYTKAVYTPTKETFVVYGDRSIFPEASLVVKRPSDGYSWSELFSYKGIVHCPYEMSTMSLFEQYWAGVPVWFPTKRFYKECLKSGKMKFISIYSKWKHDISDGEIDAWLSCADFYNLPFIQQYDSFEDCIQQLLEFTDPKRQERMEWLKKNTAEILNKWKQILQKLFNLE